MPKPGKQIKQAEGQPGKKPGCLRLFLEFIKIGLMTFSGYAILPIIQRELIDHRGWLTEEQAQDYFAIGQATPGLVAINVSTFVGYSLHGLIGSILATVAFVLPGSILVCILGLLFVQFGNLEIVEHAFAGVRIAMCVIIVNACIRLAKISLKGAFSVVLFVLALAAVLFLPIPIVLVILACGAIGLAALGCKQLFAFLKGRKQ